MSPESMLLEVSKEYADSPEAQQCVASKLFYAVLTPCIVGYAIGSIDTESGVSIPALNFTMESALEENQEMTETYLDQIQRGERDADDEWQGIVRQLMWDGGELMHVLDENGDIEYTESMRSMAGL